MQADGYTLSVHRVEDKGLYKPFFYLYFKSDEILFKKTIIGKNS